MNHTDTSRTSPEEAEIGGSPGRLALLEAQIGALLPHLSRRTRARIRERLDQGTLSGQPDKALSSLQRLHAEARAELARIEQRCTSLPRPTIPSELPIAEYADEVVRRIQDHPVIILSGETGSGKSTQLPKLCLLAGLGSSGWIGCTQPRRVAAQSVSRRIAEELGVVWGEEVGCQIRFDDRTSNKTRIKLMTDGILLNAIQQDRCLLDYDAIIIDEAHERNLNIDLLLGHFRRLVESGDAPKLIVTSATIDTEAFAQHFAGAPVVNIPGRTHPVEVHYYPPDEIDEAGEPIPYTEAAARATERLVREFGDGDILVFLPTERDIRETQAMLQKSGLPRVRLLPIFGRLSSGEQQRIFTPCHERKIVLATNIAETSITVPGIRYVVDTGLARISRHDPRTRTLRLPIEPIARSAADQRKGRCGRTGPGICLRLYSADDYEQRPRFTQPEIQRSNLAEVILRMEAAGLGAIEDFPLINRPPKRAIEEGFRQLLELGALEPNPPHRLTETGRQLARLPVDPSIGRMLLQARKEHALREVLVIAAGLSIQDPRERPADRTDQADREHRKFLDPRSDLLSLVNLWNAVHAQAEGLSQRKLREFCRSHFLSYTRMREWRDIHRQLCRVLDDLGLLQLSEAEYDYASVHRSILAGLLGQVACSDEGNTLRATHGRVATLFPGSALFDRTAEKKRQAAGRKVRDADRPVKPGKRTWFLAGHWMETSRLFACNVARIDPRWIVELGAHLLKRTVGEPFWSRQQGRVLARERAFLHGLEVSVRNVDFAQHDPERAREIFIREGLIAPPEEGVREHFGFLVHNHETRTQWEEWQTRLRRNEWWTLEERLFRFYAQRLPAVAGTAQLSRSLRHEPALEERLRLTWKAIFPEVDTSLETADFPEKIELGSATAPVEYRYRPGEEDDGATLRVSLEQLDELRASRLDWLIPGYLLPRVEAILKTLPKESRRRLIPIQETAQRVAGVLRERAFDPDDARLDLQSSVLEVLKTHYGIECDLPAAARLDEGREAQWLRPRIEVVDRQGKPVAAGRDIEGVREAVEAVVSANRRRGASSGERLWQSARRQWERADLRDLPIGSIPETVFVGEIDGLPVEAWPALTAESGGRVALRLYTEAATARREERRGLRSWIEHHLGRDLGWLQRELDRELRRADPLWVAIAKPDQLREDAWKSLRNEILDTDRPQPLDDDSLRLLLEERRKTTHGAAQFFADRIVAVLEKRQAIWLEMAKQPDLAAEVNRLAGPHFVARTPFDRFPDLTRYLDCVRVRARMRALDPAREQARQREIEPLLKRLTALLRDSNAVKHQRRELVELYWLMEELRVSTFAQKLGTRERVSFKRVQPLLDSIEAAMR